MKFKLEKPVSIKRKILFPIGFISIYFLTTYFFRNPYTSVILVIGLIIYAIYSAIKDRKYYIEFHRDVLEFYKSSGRLVFSESVQNLRIKKAALHMHGRNIGQAVIISGSDGTELKIAAYSIVNKWQGTVEQLDEVDYTIAIIKWPIFIEKLGLTENSVKQGEMSQDIQQQTEAQQKLIRLITKIFIISVLSTLIIFGLLFGWFFLTQMN